MIDIKLLEKKAENGMSYFDDYKQGLINRGASTEILEQIMKANITRKEMINTAETEKARQNKLSAEVGQLKREGKDASHILSQVDQLKARVKELETQAADTDAQVYNLLLTIPNKPHSSVPVGKSEHDNKVVKTVGEPKKFSFKAKEHIELGEKLNILDFERAAKVTGARFTFLKGAAAQMERALIQFMMDMHSTQHG
ncbi:MAG: serine--tRNA ligase, partial [Pseudobdellovibrio sp.]|nr:serine--tRNA ligase [Pseudobdellovibrio sp.]